MMEAAAKVLSVETGYALVAAQRRGACGGCAGADACGVSSIASWLGRSVHTIRLPDPMGLQPGDVVVIGLPEERLVGAAVAAYLFPLAAMIALAILGAQLSDTQLAPAMFGLAGLVGGLWCCRRMMMFGGAAGAAYQLVILRREGAIECSGQTRPCEERSFA